MRFWRGSIRDRKKRLCCQVYTLPSVYENRVSEWRILIDQVLEVDGCSTTLWDFSVSMCANSPALKSNFL